MFLYVLVVLSLYHFMIKRGSSFKSQGSLCYYSHRQLSLLWIGIILIVLTGLMIVDFDDRILVFSNCLYLIIKN